MELPLSLDGFKQIQVELSFPICVFHPVSLLIDVRLSAVSCPEGTNEEPDVVSGVTRGGWTRAFAAPGEVSAHRTRGWEALLIWELTIKNKMKELLRSLAGRQPRHLHMIQMGLFFLYIDESQEHPPPPPPLSISCGILHGALGR